MEERKGGETGDMFILSAPQTTLLRYPCEEVRLDSQAGVRASVLGGTFASVWGFFAVGGHGSLQISSEPAWDGLQGCTFAAWSVEPCLSPLLCELFCVEVLSACAVGSLF